MSYDYIEVSDTDGVLVITMDDASTRNSIGVEMAGEIYQELDRLESDATLRALVLTGRDPSFCSGGNVRRMASNAAEETEEETLPTDITPWELLERRWDEMPEEFDDERRREGRFLPLRLHNLQKPSIAAVNGYAMGLGMGIAIACDIRIGSENARFSEAFIRRGLVPGDGSCWQLPRIIGLGNTLLFQYTGDTADAEESMKLGLVNKIVPHEELMETTMTLARRLAEGPTYAMALIKRMVHESLFTDFAESLRMAGPAQEIIRLTEDRREGTRAFVEKRKAVFKGR